MGCLPLPILFVIGLGTGYALRGQGGAVWGAGIGLLAGLLVTGTAVNYLRKRR